MSTFERLALLGPWIIVGVFFIVTEFVPLSLWVLVLALAVYPFALWFGVNVWEN